MLQRSKCADVFVWALLFACVLLFGALHSSPTSPAREPPHCEASYGSPATMNKYLRDMPAWLPEHAGATQQKSLFNLVALWSLGLVAAYHSATSAGCVSRLTMESRSRTSINHRSVQGLLFAWSYNQREALRSFEAGTSQGSATDALVHWGYTYALSPFANR